MQVVESTRSNLQNGQTKGSNLQNKMHTVTGKIPTTQFLFEQSITLDK